MSECSNLATKVDISGKIDKSEKPQIVEASAGLATVAVGAAFNPRIQALAGQLAALASKLGALATRVLDLFGKLAGVLSLIGLLATQAQLLILFNDVRKLKEQLRQVSDIAEGAVINSNLAILKANAATNIANIATTNAYAAIDKANVAINSAGRAESNAQTARGEANQAVIKANAAIGSANQARIEANYASERANKAISQSNVATTKANTAINESNQAKIEAKSATAKANTATEKANTAIALSNQNAVTIEQAREEVKIARAELFGIKFAQSLIEAELDRQEKELLDKDRDIIETRTILGVTKEFVIRKVEESKSIFVSGIGALDDRLTGVETKTNSNTGISVATVTQMIQGAIKEEDKSIKDYIAGLPGIRPGTKTDSLTEGRVRDIARAEAGTAVRGLERVQDRQYTDLRDKITSIPTVLGGVVVGGIASQLKPLGDGIQRTVSQTAAPALTQAAAAGVCSTTQPGGCMNNLNSNQSKNISDYINAAGASAAAANNALLLRMQGILNTINQTTSIIKSTTDAIQKTVTNARYGLQAAHTFASTAWKTTQADKVLSVVNTALNIHNAIMLSNNLGRSMAYIADNTLAAFGIQDATTGDAIDVGSFVKRKLNSMINTMLGATQAAALRRNLVAANRIYQAGANVLYSVRSIMDSTYDIAETTGENVSQIGNALKKAGAVRENAYKLMPTDFRSTSRVQRRLEKLGNAADTIEQISSDALDVTTEVKEMKANQKEFSDELEKARGEQSKEDETKKKEAIANPEASAEDEIRTLPKEDKN
jgi:hypothetical protein